MAEPKTTVKYYKCFQYSALMVSVNDDASEYVRFTPFLEKWQGDTVKVGYLSTDNEVAQKALEADLFVETLTEDEFKKATQGKDSVQAALPIA